MAWLGYLTGILLVLTAGLIGYSPRSERPHLGAKPSRKSVKHVVRKIHALTVRSGTGQETTEVVEKVNHTLRGWASYFLRGTVSKAYAAIDAYTTMRLRRWLRKNHQVRRNGWLVYPHEYLYQTLGLVCLPKRKRNVPWAKA